MRLRTLIIFGVGYVVGARSGQDRLLDLADRARDLLGSEPVREYVARLQSGTPTRERDAGSRTGREDVDEEEAEDFDDEDPEDFDEEEPEDFDDEEPEDLDEEPEESGETDNEERPPARTRTQVRRRAPGRSRR